MNLISWNRSSVWNRFYCQIKRRRTPFVFQFRICKQTRFTVVYLLSEWFTRLWRTKEKPKNDSWQKTTRLPEGADKGSFCASEEKLNDVSRSCPHGGAALVGQELLLPGSGISWREPDQVIGWNDRVTAGRVYTPCVRLQVNKRRETKACVYGATLCKTACFDGRKNRQLLISFIDWNLVKFVWNHAQNTKPTKQSDLDPCTQVNRSRQGKRF